MGAEARFYAPYCLALTLKPRRLSGSKAGLTDSLECAGKYYYLPNATNEVIGMATREALAEVKGG